MALKYYVCFDTQHWNTNHCLFWDYCVICVILMISAYTSSRLSIVCRDLLKLSLNIYFIIDSLVIIGATFCLAVWRYSQQCWGNCMEWGIKSGLSSCKAHTRVLHTLEGGQEFLIAFHARFEPRALQIQGKCSASDVISPAGSLSSLDVHPFFPF